MNDLILLYLKIISRKEFYLRSYVISKLLVPRRLSYKVARNKIHTSKMTHVKIR